MLTRMPTRLTVPEPGPDGRQPSQMSPLGKKPPSCSHISLQASAGQPTIGQAPAATTATESRSASVPVGRTSTLLHRECARHWVAALKRLCSLCCDCQDMCISEDVERTTVYETHFPGCSLLLLRDRTNAAKSVASQQPPHTHDRSCAQICSPA